jgi:predicted NBD/HSP70 family sugar kinase
VRLELFDLALTRRLIVERSARAGRQDVGRIVEFVADGVDELLERSGTAPADVLGLGVGVPGIVEDNGTSLVHAPSIGWSGVPFAGLLEEAIGVGVTLDNGAKALGTAEAWFGAAGEAENVVVCLIGTGVGASILTGGRLYRGASASAGEWGHTTVVLDGDACRCGAHGCLEAYVGATAIAQRWRRASRARDVVDLTDDQAIERLATGAEAGRAAAVRTLRETARYLGAGLSDLINLLNPDRIVIGGWVGLRLGPLLLPLLREAVQQRALTPPFERVELELCHLGPDAVALGAATIVVDRFFAAGGRREGPAAGASHAHRVGRGSS